jgi:peptidoglycan/xylan/chitin deacetylase (PgdA/CDA1 family)
LSVDPLLFRRLLLSLIDRGYAFVTASGLLQRLGRPADGRKVICLTFDDGFIDTYTAAFPICRELGVPMTVYLVSGFASRTFPMWGLGLAAVLARTDRLVVPLGGEAIDLPCRTERERRAAHGIVSGHLARSSPEAVRACCAALQRAHGVDFDAITDRAALSPAMIREMQRSGSVEFGAHSVHHARLATLDRAEARREIAGSRQACEALVGRPVEHFAYPYGDAGAAGPREVALCAEAGFASAMTTESAVLVERDAQRKLALPRLTFSGHFQHEAQLELLLSGLQPALRRHWHRWRHGTGRGAAAARA